MNDILSRYRKAIITGGGVILFLLAGLITMIFTDSGNENAPSNSYLSESNPPSRNHEAAPEIHHPQRIMYVYITGEVRKPGVYKLSDDARIFQLVDMAGGFTAKADTESLNLAENISDGSHVHIGTKSQATQQAPLIPGMPANAARTSALTREQSQSGIVNINTAGLTELETLPGIVPALAQRIVDYRSKNGNFARPEDLVNVKGISQSKLAQLLPHITVMNTASRVIPPSSSAGIIDINRASQTELETLPGIGPALAQRIIDYRNTHGNFARPEDLVKVKGIGQSKLAQLLPHITAMNTASRVILPSSSAGLIDINRASQKELERLPGVGAVTAKRIIDYRNTHGKFTTAEDLTNIRGISRAKLDNMRGMIAIR